MSRRGGVRRTPCELLQFPPEPHAPGLISPRPRSRPGQTLPVVGHHGRFVELRRRPQPVYAGTPRRRVERRATAAPVPPARSGGAASTRASRSTPCPSTASPASFLSSRERPPRPRPRARSMYSAMHGAPAVTTAVDHRLDGVLLGLPEVQRVLARLMSSRRSTGAVGPRARSPATAATQDLAVEALLGAPTGDSMSRGPGRPQTASTICDALVALSAGRSARGPRRSCRVSWAPAGGALTRKQAQVVVDLGGGGDGGRGCVRWCALDGDGGAGPRCRRSRASASCRGTGVGGERLHALRTALGVDRVEREGGLPAAPVTTTRRSRDVDIDVLEVVTPGAPRTRGAGRGGCRGPTLGVREGHGRRPGDLTLQRELPPQAPSPNASFRPGSGATTSAGSAFVAEGLRGLDGFVLAVLAGAGWQGLVTPSRSREGDGGSEPSTFLRRVSRSGLRRR